MIDERRQASEHPALVDAAGATRLSYADLAALVGLEAQRLRSVGGGLGFCFAGNDLPTVVSYLAAMEASVPLLLLDPGLPEGPRQRLLERYRPELLLGSGAALNAPNYRRGPESRAALALALRQGGSRSRLHPDLGLLLPTSGSTGSPKLVRLSRRNLEANAVSIAEALGLAAEERAITSLPLYYSYGLSVLNSHLQVGATVVLSGEPVVQRGFWDSFRREECSSFAGVPYTYHLLKRLRFERMHLPSLRSMTQAGGRLESHMVLWFHHLMAERGASFHVMYGQTEATARISCLPPTELPARATSAGLAIPGGQLQIRDARGLELAPSQTGEVIYRGPNVMLGYAMDRADLARGDELEGELATGDQGFLDEEGFLHITGRNSRFVKITGLRINLAEVEAALRAAGPTAVVAGNDRLVVFVEGADDQELERCRRLLSQEMTLDPQLLELCSVAALPLAANGKVDYGELEKWM